jgi:hypothetical protein
MEYFKATKKAASDDPLLEYARKIVEIARLHDPEVKEFPNSVEEAAKLLYERVLKPEPDFKNGNGILNGFDDTLDSVAAMRLLQCACNLKPVKDPFSELKTYRQVKVFIEFVEGLRKRGWTFRVVAFKHGRDGEVEKVVEKRTGVHLRKIDAALEALCLVKRHTQAVLAAPGE